MIFFHIKTNGFCDFLRFSIHFPFGRHFSIHFPLVLLLVHLVVFLLVFLLVFLVVFLLVFILVFLLVFLLKILLVFICVEISRKSLCKLGLCHTKIYVHNTACQNIFGAIYVKCGVPPPIDVNLPWLELRAALVNVRNTMLNIVTFCHFQIV